jgi:hypothetical protein
VGEGSKGGRGWALFGHKKEVFCQPMNIIYAVKCLLCYRKKENGGGGGGWVGALMGMQSWADG